MLVDEQNIDEIINTITKLHQTSIDHRLIDLTNYLNEFFLALQPQHSNFIHRLTCLLHDYQNSQTLKIEFLQAKCLEIFYQLLNPTDSNNIISILEFLIEFLNNSEYVQEQFLYFNGYEKFFQLLRYIHLPTRNFINQLILLMLETKIDDLLTLSNQSLIIFNNPHIAKAILYWIPSITNLSDQQYILSLIKKILYSSLESQLVACSNGLIYVLLDIINQINDKKLENNILIDIFSLIENLSQCSINSNEIQYICQLFYQNKSFKYQLLRLLIIAAKDNDSNAQAILSYFDLQRSNSVC